MISDKLHFCRSSSLQYKHTSQRILEIDAVNRNEFFQEIRVDFSYPPSGRWVKFFIRLIIKFQGFVIFRSLWYIPFSRALNISYPNFYSPSPMSVDTSEYLNSCTYALRVQTSSGQECRNRFSLYENLYLSLNSLSIISLLDLVFIL